MQTSVERIDDTSQKNYPILICGHWMSFRNFLQLVVDKKL